MDELLELLKKIENTLRESGNWSLFSERYLKEAHAVLSRKDLQADDVAKIFIDFLETRFFPIIDDYSSKKGNLEEKVQLYERISQQLESNLRLLEQRNNELQSQVQTLEKKAHILVEEGRNDHEKAPSPEKQGMQVQSLVSLDEDPDHPEIFDIKVIPGPTIGRNSRATLVGPDLGTIDNPAGKR